MWRGAGSQRRRRWLRVRRSVVSLTTPSSRQSLSRPPSRGRRRQPVTTARQTSWNTSCQNLTWSSATSLPRRSATDAFSLYGKSPAYLANIVHPTSASRLRNSLRSASSSDYSLPRLRTKFGERAFSHAGPAAWKALPEDIRANQDSEPFRKQLKTYFLL